MRLITATLLLCVWSCAVPQSHAAPVNIPAQERHFDELRIGPEVYSNVTVTTQNKEYAFFLHSRGMMNIKVSQLPMEVRQALGYEVPPTQSVAKAWAQQTLVKLDQPEVKELQKRFETGAQALSARDFQAFAPSMGIIIGALAVAVAFYVFICYCCMLICKKTGQNPGAMVWLPVVQMVPLLRAAGMSPVWLIAWLIPVLNLVAQILWSFKIAKARGKTAWTGFFLVLPITSIFAFLYLAFSDGQEPAEEKKTPLMALGAT